MITEYDFIPKCMKFSIFFLNITYWLLGISSSGVGLYVHSYQMQPIQDLISMQLSPAFMLIVMGIVLFITAIFGCVGAMRENMYVLRWYLVTLLFLLMVHIAVGVVAFVVLFFPPTVHVQTEEMMQKAMLSYKDDAQSADYINKIQMSVQCCGIGPRGYKDWMMNPYFACTDNTFSSEKCSVPPSCCRFDSLERIDSTCGFGTTNEKLMSQHEASSVINIQGCIPKIEETAQNAAALLGFSAFGIATALICGIVLSSRMLNTLEIKVNEYWKRFNFENNMMHYIPNSAIYHIPNPVDTQKNMHPTKSGVPFTKLSPFYAKSSFLL